MAVWCYIRCHILFHSCYWGLRSCSPSPRSCHNCYSSLRGHCTLHNLHTCWQSTIIIIQKPSLLLIKIIELLSLFLVNFPWFNARRFVFLGCRFRPKDYTPCVYGWCLIFFEYRAESWANGTKGFDRSFDREFIDSNERVLIFGR